MKTKFRLHIYAGVLATCLSILFLTGCNTTPPNNGDLTENTTPQSTQEKSEEELTTYYNTFENFESTFTLVREKTDNYTILYSDKHAGDFYAIYDNYGNLLDKGYHGYRGAFAITENQNIITLKYGFGGTNTHPVYRLYDAKNGIASRYFDGPVAVAGSLVAYFDVTNENATLIVQDAFDATLFRKEFSGEFDDNILLKIQEITFTDNETSVTVKHCETDNESHIIEETFPLN